MFIVITASNLWTIKKPYGNITKQSLFSHNHYYYYVTLFQFVIVGIVRESLSYSKVKGGDIRLLDLIGTVNDTPCDKIFSPGADIQERFEQYIEGKDSIKLLLNHLSSLPSVSDSLKCGK